MKILSKASGYKSLKLAASAVTSSILATTNETTVQTKTITLAEYRKINMSSPLLVLAVRANARSVNVSLRSSDLYGP
jgi:hypothetical protein